MIMVDFGNRLKKLRLNAGLTQKQLADKMGVTASVVSYYELSERNPSPEVLIKLASIFHISTDYLLGIEKTESLSLSDLDEADKKLIFNLIENLKKKKQE